MPQPSQETSRPAQQNTRLAVSFADNDAVSVRFHGEGSGGPAILFTLEEWRAIVLDFKRGAYDVPLPYKQSGESPQ